MRFHIARPGGDDVYVDADLDSTTIEYGSLILRDQHSAIVRASAAGSWAEVARWREDGEHGDE